MLMFIQDYAARGVNFVVNRVGGLAGVLKGFGTRQFSSQFLVEVVALGWAEKGAKLYGTCVAS